MACIHTGPFTSFETGACAGRGAKIIDNGFAFDLVSGIYKDWMETKIPIASSPSSSPSHPLMSFLSPEARSFGPTSTSYSSLGKDSIPSRGNFQQGIRTWIFNLPGSKSVRWPNDNRGQENTARTGRHGLGPYNEFVRCMNVSSFAKFAVLELHLLCPFSLMC